MATLTRGFTSPRPISAGFPGKEPISLVDRSIGDFLRQARQLSDGQIDEILAHQQLHGMRFGEAAVALQLASSNDVLWALSQQFHYPYAPNAAAQLNEELVAAVDPFSDLAEAFRELRSHLLMDALAPDQPRRALAVLSPDIGDGKTFFAANMAVTLSQLGARTLLIDADMRTPRQHQLFGVSPGVGLSSILSGRAEPNVIHHVPDLPSLSVLAAGTVPPNPLELVQRPAFGLLIQELLSKFDHVVVDTPAAVHGADGRVVAAKCGAALAIGRRGRTRMKSMDALVSAMARTPVMFAGVMLNEH
jgi:chain length determinant protein tyrosine kinase EpsG